MVTRLFVIAIAAIVFSGYGAGPATGDSHSTVTTTTGAQDKDLAADSAAVPLKIAKEFNVPVDSVLALRAAYKIGWGGISKAYALAQNAEGYSVRDILNLKTEKKMGWGQIAQKLDVKPGEAYKPAGQTSGSSASADKMEMNAEKQQQKADRQQEKMEAKENRTDPGKK
jgi:hypothetical protein